METFFYVVSGVLFTWIWIGSLACAEFSGTYKALDEQDVVEARQILSRLRNDPKSSVRGEVALHLMLRHYESPSLFWRIAAWPLRFNQ